MVKKGFFGYFGNFLKRFGDKRRARIGIHHIKISSLKSNEKKKRRERAFQYL